MDVRSVPKSYQAEYNSGIKKKSRTKAVNSFCRQCFGWENVAENIRECTAITCPLYAYRPYQNTAKGTPDKI